MTGDSGDLRLDTDLIRVLCVDIVLDGDYTLLSEVLGRDLDQVGQFGLRPMLVADRSHQIDGAYLTRMNILESEMSLQGRARNEVTE